MKSTQLLRICAALGMSAIMGGCSPPPAISVQRQPVATTESAREEFLAVLAVGKPADFPIKWPARPLTRTQLDEATACDLPALREERYPEPITVAELSAGPIPETACDWAVLAGTYAVESIRTETPIPAEGQAAYLKTVALNPAFALKSWLVAGNLAPREVVEAPPVTETPIRTVRLALTFGTLGYSARAQVDITNADTSPTVSGSFSEDGIERSSAKPFHHTRTLSQTISLETIQSLSAALTDLIPVDDTVSLYTCTDYDHDWEVELIFADGSHLTMTTNQSTLLTGGGPWVVAIAGRLYVQATNVLSPAMTGFAEELGIGKREPAAARCLVGDNDIIFDAFP